MKQRMKEVVALLLSAAMIIPTSGGVLAEEIVPQQDVTAMEAAADAKQVSGDENPTEPADTASHKAMTVMLYIDGSNLEGQDYFATMDMTEIVAGMTAAGTKAGLSITGNDFPVNVIVETGGIKEEDVSKRSVDDVDPYDPNHSYLVDIYNKYTDAANKAAGSEVYKTISANDDPSLDNSPYPVARELVEEIKWDENERWELTWGEVDEEGYLSNYLKPALNNKPNEKSSMLGENKETGVNDELYDFVATTIQNYPSDYYALILWDHGGGQVNGFGSDDRYPDDSLTADCTEETLAALKKNIPNFKLNLAGYDACLMSNFETTMAWEGYADYLFASEDLEGGSGWFYTPWFAELCYDLAAKTEGYATYNIDSLIKKVGKINVDSFVDWYQNDTTGTLAVLDLTTDGMKNLKAKVDTLAKALTEYMGSPYYIEAALDLYQAANAATSMSSMGSGMIDLKSFCDKLAIAVDNREDDDTIGDKVEAAAEDISALLSRGKQEYYVENQNVTLSPVYYFDNISFYERDYDQEEEELVKKELGGVSIFFPYLSDKGWTGGEDTFTNIYRDFPDLASYKETVGDYLAIEIAGRQATLDMYNGEFAGNEKLKKELQNKINANIEKYSVSDNSVAASVRGLVNDIAPYVFDRGDTRYEEVLLNDTASGNETVSGNKGYKTQILQDHLNIAFGAAVHGEITYSDGSYLGLGYFPDANQDEDQIIFRNLENKDWFYLMGSDGNEKMAYPSGIFDVASADDDEVWDCFTEELYADLPVMLEKISRDESGKETVSDQQSVLLEVKFDERSSFGTILGYRDFDLSNVNSVNSRYHEASELGDAFRIIPVYNTMESLMNPANKSFFPNKLAPLYQDTKNGKVIKFYRGQPNSPELGEDAVTLEAMDAALAKALGENFVETGKTPVIWDIFQGEYELTNKNDSELSVAPQAPFATVNDQYPLTPDNCQLELSFPAGDKKDPVKVTIKLPADESTVSGNDGTVSGNGDAVSGNESAEKSLTYDDKLPFLYFASEQNSDPSKRTPISSQGVDIKGLQTVYVGVDESMLDAVIQKVYGPESDLYRLYKRAYTFKSGGEASFKVVKHEIDPEDQRSPLDPAVSWKYGDSITLVKGQKVTFEAGEWETDPKDQKAVTITNKGVATAKAVTTSPITLINKKSVGGPNTITVDIIEPFFRTVASGADAGWLPKGSVTVMVGEELDLGSEFISGGENSSLDRAFISSNPRVIRVDQDGKCYASAKGTAKITAYVNGKAYNYTVKATDLYSTSVYNTETKEPFIPKVFGTNENTKTDTVYLVPGQTLTLKYDKKTGFNPSKAKWEGGEDAVATIKNGKITAVGAGSVTLTGVYKSGESEISYDVSVEVVAKPAKAETYLTDGQSETLKYYKVKNSTATWTLEGEGAKLETSGSKAGKLTAGSTESGSWQLVTVRCSPKEGTEFATVAYIENLDLETGEGENDLKKGTKAYNYTLNMKKNTRFQISAYGIAHAQTLNWKSSKAAVAFADEYGIIEARAEGSAKITAKVDGKTITILVTVQ